MNSMQLGDLVLHYRFRPARPGAPTIVFINSLGTDLRIWDRVIGGLGADCGTLAYDKRGHGLSETGVTPYSIADHAGDLAGLMDGLGISGAVICGVSVGGQIAQQLYFDRPDLVAGLVLSNTAAKIGTPEFWHDRIETISRSGLEAATDGIMERWFSAAFRGSGAPDYAVARTMFARQPIEGYLATCAAIAGFDRSDDSGRIVVPAAVLVGSEDGATPPDLVEGFSRGLADSSFEIIEGVGHLPCIETPRQVADAIGQLVDRLKERRMRDAAS